MSKFKNEPVKTKISDLRPSQFFVGLACVEEKIELVNDKLGKKGKKIEKLDDYLKTKKPVPIALAPDGNRFIVDHHHLARGVIMSRAPEKYVYTILQDGPRGDLSKCGSMDKFWEIMKERKWCYLEDNGVIRPPSELPRTVDEMKDDPYRSLAYFVRENSPPGFVKVKGTASDVPFSEFYWAGFLRKSEPFQKWLAAKNYTLGGGGKAPMEKSPEVIKRAVELCRAVTGLEMTTFNLHGSLSGAVALPLSSVGAIESKSSARAESKSSDAASSSDSSGQSAQTLTSKDSATSSKPGQTGSKDTSQSSPGSLSPQNKL